jgi:predicted PurR-regulated permease PerM
MWLPFSLYEFSQGNTHNALFIALYTIIVISLIADTFVKPFVIKLINQSFIKPQEKINELIIFFAIIAGLATFGFWGMIIGPALTVLFLTLLRITETQQEEEPR